MRREGPGAGAGAGSLAFAASEPAEWKNVLAGDQRASPLKSEFFCRGAGVGGIDLQNPIPNIGRFAPRRYPFVSLGLHAGVPRRTHL